VIETARPVRIGCLYQPNGNPVDSPKVAYKLAWFDRLQAHARALLAQREVIIRDAQVSWEDQLRQAPLLSLADLNFVMRNRGNRHRFALRAQPPRELAAAPDVQHRYLGI